MTENITITMKGNLREQIEKVCGINRSKWIRGAILEKLKKLEGEKAVME